TFSLQWGHGEFAVDDPTRPRAMRSRSTDFNGATANSPWMTMKSARARATEPTLQWGHGEFAVDDSLRSSMSCVTFALQWGHGEFAVDDAPPSPSPAPPTAPFNGATANSPWMTSSTASWCRRLSTPSMGPRRIRRG